MRRWLPILLLSLFAYDVAADAFEADCLEATEETCCACICQTHAANPETARSIAAPTASASRPPQGDTLFTAHLSDKSLFHPPSLLA